VLIFLNSHQEVLLSKSVNHKKTEFILLSLLIISFVLLTLNSAAYALDTIIGVNAGYDNNVNSTPDESGSSFAACHINLNHRISHEKAFGKSNIYLNTFYQNYSRFEDNLSVNSGAYYSCYPGSERLMAFGLVEAGIYRDEEDKFDELNRLKTGGQLKFFYNGRLTFQLAQFFNWIHYLEPIEYAIPIESGDMDTDYFIQSKKRNDCYMSSDIGINVRIHPMVNMTIFGLYNRRYSNISTEAYDGFGSSLFCRFSPDLSWGISSEAFIWENDFDGNEDRTDIFRSANIIVNFFIDRYELFLRADLMDNDSSLDYETYQRLITKCGFTIFF